MRSLRLSLLASLLVAACGGGNNPDPMVVAGGGVANGGIDGTVHVYVIDSNTEAPLQGATVYVNPSHDTTTPIMGTTDANGLFTASGSLSGPQDVSAVASGYASATYYGANGANVTVALTSQSQPSVAEATMTGTVTGWDQMSPPNNGAVVALIGYSDNGKDGDPANSIQQPSGGQPPNLCIKSIINPTAACDWSEITRTGSVAMYAYLGTADTSQNVTLTGFAYKTGLTVQDGVDQSGISLDVAAAGDLTTPSVSLPSAPAGTTTVNAVARLDLGDDGRIPFPLSGQFGAAPLPKTSLFAGSSYALIGIANSTSDANATSLQIQRGLAAIDASAQLSTFQALPTGLAATSASLTFTAVTGASVHVLNVKDANGTDQWGVVVLDDSTSVSKPSWITLPSGSLTFQAQAITSPGFDPENFSVDDVKNTITADSQAGVTFTN